MGSWQLWKGKPVDVICGPGCITIGGDRANFMTSSVPESQHLPRLLQDLFI